MSINDWEEPAMEFHPCVTPGRFLELSAQAWPDATLANVYRSYVHEHVMRKGQDVPRVIAVARHFCEFFGWDRDAATLKLADFAALEDKRRADGVGATSVRREFTYHRAAVSHAFKRERVSKIPHIVMPEGTPAKRRPLSMAEYELLMKKAPMSYRTRMYFRMAFWTGHRASAIEQLTWDRVHFDSRTIDFNVPGMRITSKRRVDGFPIPDELMPLLLAAKERRESKQLDDPYVIGAGCNTYFVCKQALKSVGIHELGLCRHTLRKTFVTERIKAGKDPEKVAALIGDNAGTMRKSYLILQSEDLRASANL